LELPELFSWPSLAFAGFVAVVLVLDLFVFHRESREQSLREAALWTVVWCSLALGFNFLIWRLYGMRPAVEFFTGYLVEWTLSMDNVFVFAVIFRFFHVPKKYQYRVLFWGILGAVLMRLTFIALGVQLLEWFKWMLLLFAGILIYTAFKLAFAGEVDPDPENNVLLRFARKMFPVARQDHGDAFFAREAGRLCITPLFLVLLVIESTDVVFAVDSVPAIFGITKEPFLIFTSNVFAILGLRALYFLLAGVMEMFRYLHYGLAAVLAFVGLKMSLEYFIDTSADFREWFDANLWGLHDGHAVPPLASLTVIASLLGASIIASLLANRFLGPPEKEAETDVDEPSDSAAALPEEAEESGDQELVAERAEAE
jgi:tellurite resistance protein TerC